MSKPYSHNCTCAILFLSSRPFSRPQGTNFFILTQAGVRIRAWLHTVSVLRFNGDGKLFQCGTLISTRDSHFGLFWPYSTWLHLACIILLSSAYASNAHGIVELYNSPRFAIFRQVNSRILANAFPTRSIRTRAFTISSPVVSPLIIPNSLVGEVSLPARRPTEIIVAGMPRPFFQRIPRWGRRAKHGVSNATIFTNFSFTTFFLRLTPLDPSI